jgi:hypothetical protein
MVTERETMIYRTILSALALIAGLLTTITVMAAEPAVDAKFSDDFSESKMKERRALRGDWKFTDGVAQCTQDDELYKKYKDHGPIIFYDLPLENAVIKFRFRPQNVRTFVFTANGKDGHVFRFVVSERGLNLRAFPLNGDAKSIALHVEPMQVLKAGEWTKVSISLKDDKAVVQLGDSKPITVEHASLKQAKTNLSVGFSFGTLAVSDFVVEK